MNIHILGLTRSVKALSISPTKQKTAAAAPPHHPHDSKLKDKLHEIVSTHLTKERTEDQKRLNG